MAVAFLFTGVAPSALAQYFGRNKVQYSVFDFRVLETEHFDIHYYPELEEGARDAARMAERWYTRLSGVFGHEMAVRRPIIFYADDADFRQTNVLGGQIGEGLQGAVEGFRLRLVMPLTGSYAATHHVLGHEIIHQFQFDMAQQAGLFGSFVRLPLWIIEGMAEYFALGRNDPNTAMWLRDAVIRDAFPTLEQLTRDPRYFPYRYGQAFWAWVAGNYGDEAAVQLFRASKAMPLDSAIVRVTGLTVDSLEVRWREDVEAAYLPHIRGMQAPPYRGRDLAAADPERLVELGLVGLPGDRILARDIDAGNMNVSPQISPDGRYVAFLSERDLFGIDLFLADARTGQVIRRLQSVGTDPHLDAIRFIDSAGTWSPDGERFAFVTFVAGTNEIAILDVASREIIQRIQVTGVGAIKDPDWSPDGQTLSFMGMTGGIANLYTVDVQGGRARQLTSDRHADHQPVWSPDGRQIAFVSDRGAETSFEDLTFSPLKLSIFDLDANEVEVMEVFPGAKHLNPQFSPDGESIYFISDRGGISNVYRLHRPTGNVYQVTNVATGVSGIAAHSPAISVARGTGTLMYSVFEAQAFNVYALAAEDAQGSLVRGGLAADTPEVIVEEAQPGERAEAGVIPPEAVDPETPFELEPDPIVPPADTVAVDERDRWVEEEGLVPPLDTLLATPPAEVRNDTLAILPADTLIVPPPGASLTDPNAALGVLPPVIRPELSRVESYLADAATGLPPTRDFPSRPYRARLGLDYITQPTAGVGYDPLIGFGFGGGIAMRFSDMLGDHVLGAVIQANGTFRDIGGQVVYINQRRRMNWGAFGGHIPFLQVYNVGGQVGVGDGAIVRLLQRTFMTQVGGLASYPLSQTRRFEGSAGIRRIAYGFEADVFSAGRLARISLDRRDAEQLFGLQPGDFDPIYLAEGGTAYVGDYSFFGFTSPVRGGRYRFGVDGTAGTINYATVTADYRRYLFFRPFFTLAFRGMSFGRYGPDADSGRLFPLFLGHGPLVRGYQLGTYEGLSFEQAQATLNQLYGTRIGVANVELRMPLLGISEFGLFDFPFIPTEVALFADAGIAWGQLSEIFIGGEPLGQPLSEQQPIFSAGATARINLLGALVLEFYYALAFNRQDGRLGVGGINFVPGW